MPLLVGMNRPTSKAPSWLFSFVDLSMLLLIALVQLDARGATQHVQLGNLILPAVATEQALPLKADAAHRWQLRVEPRHRRAEKVFELVQIRDARVESSERLSDRRLRERLRDLRAASIGRPLLAPHRQSTSADLLTAVAAIDAVWPGDRSTTVAPVSARPSVATQGPTRAR